MLFSPTFYCSKLKKTIIGDSKHSKTYVFFKSETLSYLFKVFYRHYYTTLEKIIFRNFVQLMDSGSWSVSYTKTAVIVLRIFSFVNTKMHVPMYAILNNYLSFHSKLRSQDIWITYKFKYSMKRAHKNEGYGIGHRSNTRGLWEPAYILYTNQLNRNTSKVDKWHHHWCHLVQHISIKAAILMFHLLTFLRCKLLPSNYIIFVCKRV